MRRGKGHSQSPAQRAAAERNWRKHQMMGALANLRNLLYRVEGQETRICLMAASKNLSNAIVAEYGPKHCSICGKPRDILQIDCCYPPEPTTLGRQNEHH
jgi:hypothetical protein